MTLSHPLLSSRIFGILAIYSAAQTKEERSLEDYFHAHFQTVRRVVRWIPRGHDIIRGSYSVNAARLLCGMLDYTWLWKQCNNLPLVVAHR
jgi:hypothetical protein